MYQSVPEPLLAYDCCLKQAYHTGGVASRIIDVHVYVYVVWRGRRSQSSLSAFMALMRAESTSEGCETTYLGSHVHCNKEEHSIMSGGDYIWPIFTLS